MEELVIYLLLFLNQRDFLDYQMSIYNDHLKFVLANLGHRQ